MPPYEWQLRLSLHRYKAYYKTYERSAGDDERDSQLGLEIKKCGERYNKDERGEGIHNTDYRQCHSRPGDQTDDSRRDAFEEQPYARFADQLLQRIVCEEREGKGGQEDTYCQRKCPSGSAPQGIRQTLQR
jgi:hypothetical protein